MQAELFTKDQWGVAKCPRCGSLGTIVDMGRCCSIQLRLSLDSASKGQEAVLRTNDLQRNERRSKAA